MIVKTDAVVLHTLRFRESSKIVTLYTREFGKMSVIARGVVQPKSKYGSVLQPMSHISLVVYRKEGRDLHNMSVAEPIERYGVLMGSLERMTSGMAIVEIVNASMHDEDRNEQIFEALVAALGALNREDADETSVHLWFLVRLANLLGYAVRTDECGICEEPVEPSGESVPYSLSVGAPLCAEHRDAMAYRSLSPAAFDLLRLLSRSEAEEIAWGRSDPRAVSELVDTLTTFIRYHVEGLRRLKVRNVSAKVLDQKV